MEEGEELSKPGFVHEQYIAPMDKFTVPGQYTYPWYGITHLTGKPPSIAILSHGKNVLFIKDKRSIALLLLLPRPHSAPLSTTSATAIPPCGCQSSHCLRCRSTSCRNTSLSLALAILSIMYPITLLSSHSHR